MTVHSDIVNILFVMETVADAAIADAAIAGAAIAGAAEAGVKVAYQKVTLMDTKITNLCRSEVDAYYEGYAHYRGYRGPEVDAGREFITQHTRGSKHIYLYRYI